MSRANSEGGTQEDVLGREVDLDESAALVEQVHDLQQLAGDPGGELPAHLG